MWQDEPEEQESYDVAEICLNGHITNRFAATEPQRNTAYCQDCGSKTIRQCPACKLDIRGYHHIPRVSYSDDSPAPRFCRGCGKPYPWTNAKLDAARVLAEESGLDEQEQQQLATSIADVMTDTPKTEVASIRIRRLLAKVGKEVGGGLRKIIIDVASEAAKKMIFGS